MVSLFLDTIEISKQYIHNRLYQEKIGVPDVRRLSICSRYLNDIRSLPGVAGDGSRGPFYIVGTSLRIFVTKYEGPIGSRDL